LIEWFIDALRQNPALGLLLALGLGFLLGRVRIGSFQLGPMLGCLIAGASIGQFGIDAPQPMQSLFFLMFLFGLGFRTGPEFFQSLRADAWPQIALSVFLIACTVAVTWVMAWMLVLHGGTAAGLLSGAFTSSTALGTATETVDSLGLDAGESGALVRDITTTYALTYLLGTVLFIWFLTRVGPWLMRVNLRDACRATELKLGLEPARPPMQSAPPQIVARAYRLPAALSGTRVAEIEARWPPDERVVVERVRRNEGLIDVTPDSVLRDGDTVVVAGRPSALLHASRPLVDEVHDPELLDIPTVSAEFVLTRRDLGGRTLEELAREVGARDIFLLRLRRGGRELPFARGTVIKRGDVLSVTGRPAELARVATQVGFAEFPTTATDLGLVGTAMAAGGLVGMLSFSVKHVEIGLSAPVGVLFAGLIVGHLRLLHPRFARMPEASVRLFESLGLASFLALVGIGAGPGIAESLRGAGPMLLAAGAVVATVPLGVSILVGRYVIGMDPGILLGVCAGAGTSAPALAELERLADSKVPTLSYGYSCAIGNVLLAVAGTLLVLFGSR
jgi:putative transport protein